MSEAISKSRYKRRFAFHGWVGLSLISIFWPLNWLLTGPRTIWGFFPLWLGYCLVVDALVYARKGSSLLARDRRKYIGLFLISAPVWWLFEVLNWRLQNWSYEGSELFSPLIHWFWATLSFTTVIPAVFGTTELISTFKFLQRPAQGLVIYPNRRTTMAFFLAGLVMFTMMMIWPKIFFPFLWLSLFFLLEPINIWLGNYSLTYWLRKGDWRPILNLWIGVLVTGLFWEFWNHFSHPKWVYQVPWGGCCKIFEMPLLGYGGYLPFALELFAVYHLVVGFFGQKDSEYIQIAPQASFRARRGIPDFPD